MEETHMVSNRTTNEKARQEGYHWNRSAEFATYNSVLGYYQAQACLEHAHGPALLDLACGDGAIAAVLAEHFKRVVAVDASGCQLAEAKRRLPHAEFHECLIEDLNTDEKFDTVTMLNILEHVSDSQAVLKKAASVMKNDGVMIVHVPNEEAINRRIAVAMGTITSLGELSPFDIDIAGHRRSYSMDTLIREAENAGLRVKATGGVFYKQLSMAQMDWFLS
jgi:2-polyprenyl-3-methyl-5-hydroxy-6-metoxy-1,4-benzoquinol methylase